MVEVYSGDSGSGGSMAINTCVSLGGDRRLFSLTLYLSLFSSEWAVTMIGDELLVSNGGDGTMYADSSEVESGRVLSLNSGNQELIQKDLWHWSMVKEDRIKKKVPAFTVSWSKVSISVLVASGYDRTDRYLVILIIISSIICEVKYDNILKSIKVFRLNERNISNRNGVGRF